MSHTQSRGITGANHWVSVMHALIPIVRRVARSGICHEDEVPQGVHASILRFFDAALGGLEFSRTSTLRVPPLLWSLTNCSIACKAALKIPQPPKNKKEFEAFLREMHLFVRELTNPHRLTPEERLVAERTLQFFQEVIRAGELDFANRRYLDDDDE